jgi:hypothetical protein
LFFPKMAMRKYQITCICSYIFLSFSQYHSTKLGGKFTTQPPYALTTGSPAIITNMDTMRHADIPILHVGVNILLSTPAKLWYIVCTYVCLDNSRALHSSVTTTCSPCNILKLLRMTSA